MNDWQQKDYPAAHSMDAVWWGVDAQGYVARFETSKSGAKPEVAPQDEQGRLDSILQYNAPDISLEFFADDLFDQADGKMYARTVLRRWDDLQWLSPERCGDPFGYLVWAKDEAVLERLRELVRPTGPSLAQRFRAILSPEMSTDHRNLMRVQSRDRVVGWIESSGLGDPVPGMLEEMLASGDLLRVWKYRRGLEIERFGFFHYRHDVFDDWACGPLAQTKRPPRPVKLTDLPAQLADLIRMFAAPVDFTRDAVYQPFEYGPAVARPPHWVSTLGQYHRGDAPERRYANVPPGVQFQGKTELTALLAACLFGDGGTPEVVNDYLQERGLPPLAVVEGAERRLEEVLHALFTPEERMTFEIDCLVEAFARTGLPAEETQQLQEWLDVARGFLRSERTDEDLWVTARRVREAWRKTYRSEDEAETKPRKKRTPPLPELTVPPEVQRLRWGTMALLYRWPLIAARAARSLDDELLAWQIEHALALLDARYG